MGINTIKCEESYAKSGKANFGEGTRTASDFDGEDRLMGAALTLGGAMMGAMLTFLCYEWNEKPQYPVKRVTIEGFEKGLPSF